PTPGVRPTGGWAALNLRALWPYRARVCFMTSRDVQVGYQPTAMGAGWPVLQPCLATVVLSVIFGRLAKVPSDGVPYPVSSFSALLPWTFFATAITQAGTSLVTNINLVSKVYFPRLIVPTAGVLVGIVDFAVAFVVLFGMM